MFGPRLLLMHDPERAGMCVIEQLTILVTRTATRELPMTMC